MLTRTLTTTCAAILIGTLYAEDTPPAKPVRKTSFQVNETRTVEGTVLAVTKTSILIKKYKGLPTTYPAHDCLAAGKVHKFVRSANSYLLADVQAGDTVYIDTVVEDKQEYCVAIQLTERPRGLIPAGQIVDKERPYHECVNAFRAFRDKGTPIPEHLKPVIPTVSKPK